MGRKKNIDTFGCPVEEDIDNVSGFSDEPTIIKGKCLSSFSFDDPKSDDSDNNGEVIISQVHKHEETISKDCSFTDSTTNTQNSDTDNSNTNLSNPKSKTDNSKENTTAEIFDNRKTPIANGAAPAIDGETPSIRRCYILRESTIRKINELKMMDTDINVCVSTIVDLAIDYYHRIITNTKN